MSTYGNTVDARAFWMARGMPVGTWTDGAIDVARLVASEYIDAKYGRSFSGMKIGERAQIREWPRCGAYDRDGWTFAVDEYPRELLDAVYLATWYQMTTPGSLVRTFTPRDKKRASVDGAVSVEYVIANQAYEIQTQYPLIESAIAPILTAVGGNSSMLSGTSSRA